MIISRELDYAARIIRQLNKTQISNAAQIEKVDAMNPLDENYEKEVAKLIALQDATDRRKPKVDWLGWFKAVGDVGLGIVTVASTLAIAGLSFRSSEEMKMCDGRIFNLKNDFRDARNYKVGE